MIGSLCVYGRKRGWMETWYYEVVSIDGDYAKCVLEYNYE